MFVFLLFFVVLKQRLFFSPMYVEFVGDDDDDD